MRVTEQERFIRIVRVLALIAMSVVIVLTWGHIAFGWFKYDDSSNAWYYPLVISLEVFFILVQVWIIRIRRSTS